MAKRREFARKPVSKKGRMRDKNPVLVKVAYEGTKRSFEMPRTSELGELQSLVRSSLKLEDGTYDIQYFDGAEYISVARDANLHCCFANAPRSPVATPSC
ncbi:hypothetical protein Vadar_006201 [Vaccinium darrowii]|uniref:Uncharacterized protein n=1 Tax=Vaccinium darrowii TaxID=229202 RepID=A0ACB7ZAT0_9ERIC|nr:hypothetical protein Vadar_006201 [Vaccinium darrowii]